MWSWFWIASLCDPRWYMMPENRIYFNRTWLPGSQKRCFHSLKVFFFPFITNQWYNCQQQPHLQRLFHHLSSWMMSLFFIWWSLVEDCSFSSIRPFHRVIDWKMVILQGYKGEEASEQQMSCIFLFFFFFFCLSFQHTVVSAIASHYLVRVQRAGKSWTGQSEGPDIWVC